MITQPYNSNYWDLLVCDRDGQPTLIVEVKSKIGTSSEWVSNWRRNILVHETLPSTPYLLFAFPDKFYLWKDNSMTNYINKNQPDYTIDASSILQPYFQEINVQNNHIRESSLEMIVASWLNDIMYSETNVEELEKSHSWLIDSGLYASLLGGKIVSEANA